MPALVNPREHRNVNLRPGLLAAFEPWELQQIDHIDYFIKRLCAALEVAGEARTAGRLVISEVKFGEMLSHVECLVQYMQTHQYLVDTAFHLMPTLRGNVGLSGIGDNPPEYSLLVQRYSLPCFWTYWQNLVSARFPSAEIEEEGDGQQEPQGTNGDQHHATVNFAGDEVDLVPFGWIDALSGWPVSWYGEAFYEHPEWGIGNHLDEGEERLQNPLALRLTCLNMWRGAGFALWDRRRVEAMKMLDHLTVLRTGWIVQMAV